MRTLAFTIHGLLRLALIALAAWPVGSTAIAAIKPSDEQLAEELNTLIDSIPGEAERYAQRRQMQNLASALLEPNYRQAAHIAQLSALHAPTPKLRKKWKSVGKLFEKRAVKQEAEMEKAIETALASLGEPWQSVDSKSLAAIKDRLDKARSLQLNIHRAPDHVTLQSRLLNVRVLVDRWRLIVEAEEAGRYAEAVQQIDSLIQTKSIEEIPTERLQQRLAELQAKTLEFVAQFVTETKQRLATAKTAEDVQKVQQWIRDQTRDKFASHNAPGYKQAKQLDEFARRWYSVLYNENLRRFSGAIDQIKYLEGNADTVALLGADWIESLAATARRRIQKMEKEAQQEVVAAFDNAVERTTSPAQLDQLNQTLQTLMRNQVLSTSTRTDLARLQSDISYLKNLKSVTANRHTLGLGTWINRRASQPRHRWSAWTDTMERQLVILSIAATGQIKDLTPREGEAIGPLLLRKADEAVAQRDWHQVYQLLNAYKAVFAPNTPGESWLGEELEAIQNFNRGQLLEQSGNPGGAIAAYREVLKQSAARVPRKDAAERLAELRKKHPDLFAP